MENFEITKQQLEAVISYLVRRPYNEVAELINMLLRLRSLPAEEPPTPARPVG